MTKMIQSNATRSRSLSQIYLVTTVIMRYFSLIFCLSSFEFEILEEEMDYSPKPETFYQLDFVDQISVNFKKKIPSTEIHLWSRRQKEELFLDFLYNIIDGLKLPSWKL